MGDGGIQECGYAQNCVEVCPKDIPLTRSIAEVGGEVMKQAIGDLFRNKLENEDSSVTPRKWHVGKCHLAAAECHSEATEGPYIGPFGP